MRCVKIYEEQNDQYFSVTKKEGKHITVRRDISTDIKSNSSDTLKFICKAYGVRNFSKLKKKELVKVVEKIIECSKNNKMVYV